MKSEKNKIVDFKNTTKVSDQEGIISAFSL